MNKTIGKKILISVLVFFTIILAILIYLDGRLRPLPEEQRNMSTSNVRMLVDMEDRRSPIIRTYTKEEFDSLGEKQLNKIENIVNGNVEGDVPALRIKDGKGILEIYFERIENNNDFEVRAKIIPDNIPKIKIFGLDTLYNKEDPKVINDSLIESEEEGIYLYEIKRYFNQDEMHHNENDKLFMESMFIEIEYEINKEGYVSIFAINTIEYKEE